MVASIGFISLVDSTCKAFTDELHAVQLVWGYFLGIFSTLCLYFLVRQVGFRELVRTNRPLLQWLRPACLVSSIMFLFVGLTHLPLADATAIGFMAPLFITALSVPLLKEQVSTSEVMPAEAREAVAAAYESGRSGRPVEVKA